MRDHTKTMTELKRTAAVLAKEARRCTDSPGVGVAACFVAGFFWAEKCGMTEAALKEILDKTLNIFYHDQSQNDIDTLNDDH